MMLMENADLMASVFFGILDPRRQTLRFSNAGHPPPLLYRKDGSIEELLSGDLLLGLSAKPPRTTMTVALTNATSLVCYTDGLVEFSRNILEGEGHLRRAIEDWLQCRTGSLPSHLLRRVVRTLASDDIAILTIAFD